MIRLAQFGAGRIGQVHAANVAAHPEASLACVVDIHQWSARTLADRYGAAVRDATEVFSDADVDAVLIASSTDTHLDLILAAVEAEKPIFCEKPVDLSLERVDAQIDLIEASSVPVQIGFQRRYDTHLSGVKSAIDERRLGDVEVVKITSRDPPPHGHFRGWRRRIGSQRFVGSDSGRLGDLRDAGTFGRIRMSDRVFVGTRKGLFRLEKGSAGSWGIEGRDFIGDNVNIEAVGTGLRKSGPRSLRYEVLPWDWRRRFWSMGWLRGSLRVLT